jgi:hypothetical protein
VIGDRDQGPLQESCAFNPNQNHLLAINTHTIYTNGSKTAHKTTLEKSAMVMGDRDKGPLCFVLCR